MDIRPLRKDGREDPVIWFDRQYGQECLRRESIMIISM